MQGLENKKLERTRSRERKKSTGDSINSLDSSSTSTNAASIVPFTPPTGTAAPYAPSAAASTTTGASTAAPNDLGEYQVPRPENRGGRSSGGGGKTTGRE